MKSADRCKHHYQGDRCQRSRGHDSLLDIKPNAKHVGQFTAWTGSGDDKVVVAKAIKTSMRKNRRFNCFLKRVACAKQFNPNLVPLAERMSMKQLLQFAVAKLRGGIQQ